MRATLTSMWCRLPFFVLLSACGSGLSDFNNLPPPDLDADADVDTDTDADSDTDTDADGPNTAPVAIAVDDFVAQAGQVIALVAEASYDPDGDELTYAWEMTEHPAGWSASIVNPNRARAEFFADTPGTYTASVEV
ncbi:MAG: hypothetical protein KC656_37800, partial [Myxococcales bacterium]|nr:hypothetical protein [Myxococcales bacterium]